tara:strand:- start:2117 stop:2614 length:498 start_codon:yes stop_codon:yes gene_type:complete
MGIYDFSSADARTIDTDFKPLPDGEYLMSIDYAEILETNSKRGEHLKLELVVLESPDGNNQNRRVFQYHMIRHDNETSQRIGREMIEELGRAIGLPEPMNIQDTNQFTNKAVRARLIIKKGSGDYGDSNEVEKYFAYQDSPDNTAKILTPPPSDKTEAVKDDIPF